MRFEEQLKQAQEFGFQEIVVPLKEARILQSLLAHYRANKTAIWREIYGLNPTGDSDDMWDVLRRDTATSLE